MSEIIAFHKGSEEVIQIGYSLWNDAVTRIIVDKHSDEIRMKNETPLFTPITYHVSCTRMTATAEENFLLPDKDAICIQIACKETCCYLVR